MEQSVAVVLPVGINCMDTVAVANVKHELLSLLQGNCTQGDISIARSKNAIINFSYGVDNDHSLVQSESRFSRLYTSSSTQC